MDFLWRCQSYFNSFFKSIRKEKQKPCASGDSNNRRTERIPHKCFRYVSKYHLVANVLKPLKDNEKKRKQVCFSERDNPASQK